MLLTPFFMTLIAGLSTIIGYFFIYIKTKDINKFIVICLSFSVGVILSLSVLDLLPSSIRVIYKSSSNLLLTTIYLNLFFMIGYFLIIALKKIESPIKNDLYRVGIISFIILFIHNVLEGIATYSVSSYSITLGAKLTLGIIMHNIPEGILIAIPIYYSTKKASRALILVLISAFSEVFGAFLSYILFNNIYTDLIISYILIIVSGLMISLIINEIIVELKKYDYKLTKIISIIVGVLFIIINLFII